MKGLKLENNMAGSKRERRKTRAATEVRDDGGLVQWFPPHSTKAKALRDLSPSPTSFPFAHSTPSPLASVLFPKQAIYPTFSRPPYLKFPLPAMLPTNTQYFHGLLFLPLLSFQFKCQWRRLPQTSNV